MVEIRIYLHVSLKSLKNHVVFDSAWLDRDHYNFIIIAAKPYY